MHFHDVKFSTTTFHSLTPFNTVSKQLQFKTKYYFLNIFQEADSKNSDLNILNFLHGIYIE